MCSSHMVIVSLSIIFFSLFLYRNWWWVGGVMRVSHFCAWSSSRSKTLWFDFGMKVPQVLISSGRFESWHFTWGQCFIFSLSATWVYHRLFITTRFWHLCSLTSPLVNIKKINDLLFTFAFPSPLLQTPNHLFVFCLPFLYIHTTCSQEASLWQPIQ